MKRIFAKYVSAQQIVSVEVAEVALELINARDGVFKLIDNCSFSGINLMLNWCTSFFIFLEFLLVLRVRCHKKINK